MNKTENQRKVLGKGLNALLSSRTQAPPPPELEPAKLEDASEIGIDAIVRNHLQPREHFEPDRLAELAQSIKANGIIQPLIVRKTKEAGKYELVAGERRWRAARIAGLTKVPIVIREIPDDRLLEITLIENIQREDLNPIETALAFDKLGQEFNLSAEEVGQRTGKDRSTVLNFTRLLQLPRDVQDLVAQKKLTQGHARCLLQLGAGDQQREVAIKAVQGAWSVRQTERLVANMVDGKKKSVEEAQVDPNVKAAIQEMQRVLGTKVRIVERPRKGGRIEIEYYSQDDLDRIYTAICE
jgi:ParB family chromosome partitioning protein